MQGNSINNNSLNLTKAKALAEKNDPKIIDSINTLIDLIPKKSKKSSKEEKKGPAIFGNLYNDKGPEEIGRASCRERVYVLV